RNRWGSTDNRARTGRRGSLGGGFHAPAPVAVSGRTASQLFRPALVRRTFAGAILLAQRPRGRLSPGLPAWRAEFRGASVRGCTADRLDDLADGDLVRRSALCVLAVRGCLAFGNGLPGLQHEILGRRGEGRDHA